MTRYGVNLPFLPWTSWHLWLRGRLFLPLQLLEINSSILIHLVQASIHFLSIPHSGILYATLLKGMAYCSAWLISFQNSWFISNAIRRTIGYIGSPLYAVAAGVEVEFGKNRDQSPHGHKATTYARYQPNVTSKSYSDLCVKVGMSPKHVQSTNNLSRASTEI